MRKVCEREKEREHANVSFGRLFWHRKYRWVPLAAFPFFWECADFGVRLIYFHLIIAEEE